MSIEINKLLSVMAAKNASDMFLTAGAPIYLKIEGKMFSVGNATLTAELVEMMLTNLLKSPEQMATFTRELEFNIAVSVDGVGRFRVNAFKQRGNIGMVIRSIKNVIPSLDELNLPPVLKTIINEPRGLILVVGSTGSGKSTALAAMIDHRNETQAGHILTIEDPIEFIHSHKKSIVNQREVGFDTHTFNNALKNAMREAPDVILIGEILDTKTMEAAISFAETGHLCLATLHSNNSDQTLERILNFFPESAHKNVLMNLSLNLKAVISLRLAVDVNGKRRPATEILINTPMVRDLIRKGSVHEIKDAMDKSLNDGMQTFDKCLFKMYKDGLITLDEALKRADSRDGLALKVRLSEGASGEHYPYGDYN